MKAIYTPISLVASLIAAKFAHRLFRAMWMKLDGAEPPTPVTREASTAKVLGAATLEAAAKASTKTATKRATAHSFHYLTGFWPGDEAKAQKEKAKGN